MNTPSRYGGDLTGLTFLDETAFRRYGPEELLNRMLSTECHIPIALSAATEDEQARQDQYFRSFKQIGKGQCGSIWTLSGTSWVLKIANSWDKQGELWNDCVVHRLVRKAFEDTPLKFRKAIHVPLFQAWVHPSNNLFWNDNAGFFHPGIEPMYTIMSERILPVPSPVRAAIVGTFAPKRVKQDRVAFLSKAENKDCLIRLYLGRRMQRKDAHEFRLRNFDLHVNEMEQLRLDTKLYAQTIAQALAILHWKAKVDANDVEFVLGSSPSVKMPPTIAEMRRVDAADSPFVFSEIDSHQGALGIWLLDFNQCKEFPENATGLKQLVRGFYFNDPYYPQPGNPTTNDKELWEVFKTFYLETSASLTQSEMPKQFIDAVEAEGIQRGAIGSLF